MDGLPNDNLIRLLREQKIREEEQQKQMELLKQRLDSAARAISIAENEILRLHHFYREEIATLESKKKEKKLIEMLHDKDREIDSLKARIEDLERELRGDGNPLLL